MSTTSSKIKKNNKGKTSVKNKVNSKSEVIEGERSGKIHNSASLISSLDFIHIYYD